jgi:transitional endoplasmic reticulum ATPase
MSGRIMDQLNIVPGGIIEIVGKRNTFAKVYPFTYDDSRPIIRINCVIMRNAGVSIGDTVKVRPASLKPASKVTLAPLDFRIPEDLLYHAIRAKVLTEPIISGGIPVNSGDIIQVPMRLNTIINVIVVSIAPDSLGIITDATEITIRSEPVFVDSW